MKNNARKSKLDMIEYAESKGYEVNFGKYEYNQNVPYIKVNGCTIFIAEPLPKFGTQGLSANPNFSFKKLDNLIYYAKAYGNDNILDFSKFILEEIKSINNTFYPYFPEEIKEFEKDEYMNDCFMEWNPEGEASEFYTENEILKHNEWVREAKAQFFDLRKKILSKKGVKYKKI